MIYKRKMRFVLYAIFLSFSMSPTIQGAGVLNDISAFFNLVRQTLEILYHMQKTDGKDHKAMSVLCKSCQYPFSYAELAGHLCASGDAENLYKLNSLLRKKNIPEIKTLMLSVTNEKQINCPICSKFTTWVQHEEAAPILQ